MASEDVGLTIAEETFRFWEKTQLKLSLDTFSTLELSAPFESNRFGFREQFRPFKFQPIVMKIGDERLFTGRIVGVNPSVTPERRSVSVTAYSLPAVLHDCTTPASKLPLEFKKLTLQQIAAILCEPFGVRLDFRGDPGAKFDKIKIEPAKKIFEFLKDLAEHRNYVFTDNTLGDLLCWRSTDTGKPVARLKESEPPVTKVEASFSPQEYYSEITGFGPSRRGRKGSKHTERNPWLPDVLRPLSFKLDKIDKLDIPEATRGKMARMFAEMVSYKITLATTRRPDGQLWRPNTTITLTAPDAMVYTETELLVRDVEYSIDKSSVSAELTCVLPGVFSGEIPTSLPWDEPAA